MRLSHLVCLCLSALAHATIPVPHGADSYHLRRDRGLDGFGLFGGLDGVPSQEHGLSHTLSGEAAAATSLIPSDALGTSKKSKDTTALPTGTSYSVIGTPSPIPTPTAPPTPAPPASTPPSSSPTQSASSAASSSASASGKNEWKIIGVAVIAFSAVAAILLLSVFFDQWSRAVRRFLWRRRARDGAEELVPDWEKAEWGLRFDAGAERYPSFASLPSVPVVQMHGQGQGEPRPPPAAAVAPRDQQAHGRSPVREMDEALGFAGQRGSPVSGVSAGVAGVGVGLGLGRVGSVKRAQDASSPTSGTSTLQLQQAPGVGNTYGGKQGSRDPFADAPSPMPEDVYSGMAS